MANSFALAAAPTKLIDFESQPTSSPDSNGTVTVNFQKLGVTYNQNNADSNAGVIGPGNNAESTNKQSTIKGYNTTAGGNEFLRYSAATDNNTATFTFTKAIDAFGAYFTGVGTVGKTAIITFNDGSSQSITLLDQNNQGGVQFFGFTDFGKMISAVSLTGNKGDQVGIDDIRFALATPEPSTLVGLASSGLVGLGLAWRKRRTVV